MKKKQLTYALIVTIFAIYIVQTLNGLSLISNLELSTYDYRMHTLRGAYASNDSLNGPYATSDSILIVNIGDQSYQAMNRPFPWPRNWHGELVRNLNEAGAKLIIFDIQFDAPSPTDTLFAEAIKEAGNVIIVGKSEERKTSLQDEEIFGSTPIPPNDLLLESALDWALVGTTPDNDGIYRRYYFGNYMLNSDIEGGVELKPTLAVEAFKRIKGFSSGTKIVHDIDNDTYSIGDYSFQMVNRSGYAESTNTFMVNYKGGSNTFKWYSYESVIDDEDFDLNEEFDLDSFDDPGFPEEGIPAGLLHSGIFKDKIVLIGATLPAMGDNKATPFSNEGKLVPGVELHANALLTLLENSSYSFLPYYYNILICIFLGFLIFALAQFVDTLKAILAILLTLIIYILLSIYLFESLIVLEMVKPILTIAFVFTFNYVYNYIISYKEKAIIKDAFAHYVPPKVVEELLDNPDMLNLGGEEREMTVMFSDVEGFTTISESLSPQELVILLNEYLTAMTDIVIANNGIIDKYEGDAIMAEWGAPIKTEDHASMACKTAIEMQVKLAEMRVDWAARGVPPLLARVGINTGTMVVGNMGSRDVFDYTVMGDAVNLASRLEGANKPYHTYMMISEATRLQVKDTIRTRELDFIRVKGKTKPVEVHEVLGFLMEELSEAKEECLVYYEKGLEFYRAGRFMNAKREFSHALDFDPEDGPTQLYLERSDMYNENNPGKDWDGVFTMLTK